MENLISINGLLDYITKLILFITKKLNYLKNYFRKFFYINIKIIYYYNFISRLNINFIFGDVK